MDRTTGILRFIFTLSACSCAAEAGARSKSAGFCWHGSIAAQSRDHRAHDRDASFESGTVTEPFVTQGSPVEPVKQGYLAKG